jgi:hypothetical protein
VLPEEAARHVDHGLTVFRGLSATNSHRRSLF